MNQHEKDLATYQTTAPNPAGSAQYAQRLEKRIRELRAIEYPSIADINELDNARNEAAQINDSMQYPVKRM